MLEVARRVYPADLWQLRSGVVVNFTAKYPDPLIFNPKLTGTDREKAQALDVILAVKRLYPRSVWSFDWQEYDGQKAVIYEIGHRDEERGRGNDILTAAMLALLESK